MTDTERQVLARIEQRQEAMIAAISGMASTMAIQQATLNEMMAWLKQPPSSDLPDLLRQLVDVVTGLQEQIATLRAEGAAPR